MTGFMVVKCYIKSDQFFMLVCVHMQMGVFCCRHILFLREKN